MDASVPDEGVGGVIGAARGGGAREDGFVETGAGVSLEVFAVGVGAEDERLVGHAKDGVLGRESRDFRRGDGAVW